MNFVIETCVRLRRCSFSERNWSIQSDDSDGPCAGSVADVVESVGRCAGSVVNVLLGDGGTCARAWSRMVVAIASALVPILPTQVQLPQWQHCRTTNQTPNDRRCNVGSQIYWVPFDASAVVFVSQNVSFWEEGAEELVFLDCVLRFVSG